MGRRFFDQRPGRGDYVRRRRLVICSRHGQQAQHGGHYSAHAQLVVGTLSVKICTHVRDTDRTTSESHGVKTNSANSLTFFGHVLPQSF